VVVSGILYFQIRGQKGRIENNLNLSRTAFHEKLEESASLKSRVLNAEEISKEMTQLAEEEKLKTSGYKKQFDKLSKRVEETESGKQQSDDEVSKLSAVNRELQRQVNALQASVPPQNWREQLNQLQSRLLALEAENSSLKQSFASSISSSPSKTTLTETTSLLPTRSKMPAGKVMRIGPDGSFAILSFGRQLGAAEGQTLAIRRDQQTVALVSLTQITNDFSIAQILSSTNTGNSLSVPDIQIGDTAHLE